VIVCQGLRAGYGRRVVLPGLDLTVAAGEMVGLLGPNGAGKTTLLLTLTGAIDPLGGRVRLGGREVSELSPRRRAKRVAAVPQRLEAVPGVTVRALVLMGRYPYLGLLGGYGPADEELAEMAMSAPAWPNWPKGPATPCPREFQRVLVARAWPRLRTSSSWTRPRPIWTWPARWSSTICSRPETPPAPRSWPPCTTSIWPPCTAGGWFF
jgi:iron complex transport system ATP-binding protein